MNSLKIIMMIISNFIKRITANFLKKDSVFYLKDLLAKIVVSPGLFFGLQMELKSVIKIKLNFLQKSSRNVSNILNDVTMKKMEAFVELLASKVT